ncbi:MAG: hypothetical protein M3165_05825, partial [Actinomycetota bacterium]|nr:hypothetical protein [Actinomycetota bacterium]
MTVRKAARGTATTGVLAAVCALLVGEVATHGRRLWHQRGLLEFDDLVLLCALVVLAAAALRLTLGTGLTAATGLLGCTHTAAGRLAHRLTPALCRGLLGGACGAVLVAPSAVRGDLADQQHADRDQDTGGRRTPRRPPHCHRRHGRSFRLVWFACLSRLYVRSQRFL